MTGPLVIVGDALLDIDLVGQAERLCPDAPVPVLDRLVAHPRPGGAALAAALAAADGQEVVLVTALGVDDAGRQVEALLSDVRVLRVPYDGPTPVKQRVRSAGQSLLRLDSGTGGGRIGPAAAEVLTALEHAGAVLVADYGRGTVEAPGIRPALTRLAPKLPVVWDPHLRGGEPVPGVRLVTPNRAEAAGFAARHGGVEDGAGLLAAARRQADLLVRAWRTQAVAVTLGERGALLSYGRGTPVLTPAPAVRAADPCGAGDRFAVTAALRLRAGCVTTEAVQDAVADAAAYVDAGGPASLGAAATGSGRGGSEASGQSVDPLHPLHPLHPLVEQVRRRGGVIVATGGCFDLLHAGHVATLRAARGLGDCLVVCLNSDDSVRRLKGPSRPLVPAADRARVLCALECVDAVVVFDEDTPEQVLRRIRPDVWAKGGDYAGADVPEARVLDEWGGQAVALPYLPGRSTTALVTRLDPARLDPAPLDPAPLDPAPLDPAPLDRGRTS